MKNKIFHIVVIICILILIAFQVMYTLKLKEINSKLEFLRYELSKSNVRISIIENDNHPDLIHRWEVPVDLFKIMRDVEDGKTCSDEK